MADSLRVLSEIRFARRQDVAIVATFNANLRFFERSVHRRLRARRTLVLMDAGQYDQITKGLAAGSGPRYAGIRYGVEPVYVESGVFHPKFVLTLTGDRAHLLLGTGNLGEAGYTRNAEIFCSVETTKIEGQPLDEAGLVVAEICSFLEFLAQKELVLGDGAEMLESAVVEWAGARPQADANPSRSTWLLHSLSQPILDQVSKKIGDDSVDSITIVSPYFDPSFAIFDHCLDRFNHRVCHLYVQPGVSQLPVKAARHWPGRESVVLHEVDFLAEGERSRNLHAKLLIWKTESGAYCLHGSPNFTQAAMQSVALSIEEAMAGHSEVRLGNVEVALLQFSPQRDAFDYLLTPPTVQVEETDWNAFRAGARQELPCGDGRPRPLRLLAARYRGHRLILRFAQARFTATRLEEHEVWVQPVGESAKRLLSPTVGGDLLCVSNVKLDGSAIVWLEALNPDSGEIVKSNKRWILQEDLAIRGATDFNIEDFEECKGLGGVEGVLEALRRAGEQADNPEWLLTFLREWDLRAILDANSRERESPQKGLGLGGKPEPYPEKPDREKLLSTGIRTLVDLDEQDVIDDIRDDYVSKINQEFDESERESFSSGFRYYTVYTNLMALVLRVLLDRTADEREKLRHHQPTQYLRFANWTRDYLYTFKTDWRDLLCRGDRALGAVSRNEGRPAREEAAEFDISAFLVHCICNEAHGSFKRQGYKVSRPPKMLPLKKTWDSQVTVNVREPTRHLKEERGLEELAKLILERYEPALEAFEMELSPRYVSEQVSSLL